jgi:hypothetical protein
MIKLAVAACGIAAMLMSVGAAALEYEYSVSAGAGTSDNVTRVPANQIEEDLTTGGLDLRLTSQERKYEADIYADLNYIEYRNDTYESDVAGSAELGFRYMFVPDGFEWVITNSFGQGTTEPFEAQTPETLENINYFTTGPDGVVRLGSFGNLRALARYSRTDYEESDFNDERILGGLSLGRELSGRGVLSINATTERVEFNEPELGSDYDRHSAYLGYEIESARMHVRAEAGYSEIHDFGDSSGSPLFGLEIARDVSPNSVLTFAAGIGSSDAAEAMRFDNVLGGSTPGRPQQVSSADPFESTYATLHWRFRATRTTVSVSANYVEDVYETLSELDRAGGFLYASVERQLTNRFSVRAEGTIDSTDYQTVDQDDEETRFGLYLTWNVMGGLYFEIYGENYDRTSTNNLTEYDETRVFATLSWRDQGGVSGARGTPTP